MAAAAISLFPSASVKDGPSGQRYVSRSIKEPDFEMVKMSDGAHGIVIAVQETSVSSVSASKPIDYETSNTRSKPSTAPSITLSSPPPARTTDRSARANIRARTPSPIVVQERIHIERRSRSASPTNVPVPDSPPCERVPLPLHQDGSPKSHTTSPTLFRKGSNASMRTATYSPIMRSMFPRYDPSMSLAQQRYYPPTPDNGASSNAIRNAYSPSLCSQQERRNIRLALPVLDIPQSNSGPAPILQQASQAPSSFTPSTPEELLIAWNIANGQAVSEAADTCSLELSCDSLSLNQEAIALSSTTQAFYNLSASRNGIQISRTHPSSPQPTIQICETALSVPTTTAPLVATIFPKLAELMALDQSSSIAVSHRLDRQGSAELQAEALSRAQQNEASSLLWDSDSGKYFLIHPTLLDNASTSFIIDITPSASNPEKIIISAPEADASTPLLTLTLASRALTINTLAMTALPSLYTLDTLVSALLCLLLQLHRSSSPTALPSTQRANFVVPTFPPPPSVVSPSIRSGRTKKRSLSIWHRSNTSSSSAHLHNQQSDEEAGNAVTATASHTNTKNHESDWGYKPMIDAEDKNLPAATRAVLRTLYWGFEVLIWVLGFFVNLMAAGVVGTGKVVKKI